MFKILPPREAAYYFLNYQVMTRIVLPDDVDSTTLTDVLGEGENNTWFVLYEPQEGITVPLKICGHVVMCYKSQVFYAADFIKKVL